VLDQHAQDVERPPADRQRCENALLIPPKQQTAPSVEAEILEQVNIGRGGCGQWLGLLRSSLKLFNTDLRAFLAPPHSASAVERGLSASPDVLRKAHPAETTRREANIMKRIRLSAIGMGVLVSVGVLAVEQGFADDSAPKCTNATLKGRYLFAAPATLLPPAFGVTEKSLGSAAGYHIFDGKGGGQDFVTFLLNGIVVPVPSPAPLTYTLASDCTGTYTVTEGPKFDIFVSPDGEWLAAINTDPGIVSTYGPDKRVAPK
jgi:hypothetical protein